MQADGKTLSILGEDGILTPLLPSGSREEAHALVLVERSVPALHSNDSDSQVLRYSHKRVVDGDHEDLTGFLQLRVTDISGDVGAGASGA